MDNISVLVRHDMGTNHDEPVFGGPPPLARSVLADMIRQARDAGWVVKRTASKFSRTYLANGGAAGCERWDLVTGGR